MPLGFWLIGRIGNNILSGPSSRKEGWEEESFFRCISLASTLWDAHIYNDQLGCKQGLADELTRVRGEAEHTAEGSEMVLSSRATSRHVGALSSL